MLRNVDRFASAECRSLRVGQLVRMPIQYVGTPDRWGCRPVVSSRESYIIESFPGRGEYAVCGAPGRRWRERFNNLAHCVNLRNLATGARLTLSQFWIAPHVED